MEAIKKNPRNIEFVKYNKISKEMYEKLYIEAVKRKPILLGMNKLFKLIERGKISKEF